MNQLSTRYTAYTRPFMFLPATSRLPQVTHAAEGDCQLDSGLLHAVITTATQLTARWQQVAVIPGWIERDIATLAQQINRVAVHLDATCDSRLPLASTKQPQPLNPQALAQPELNNIMVEACTIYDRYFQVERVAAMRFDTFVGQVAESTCNLLYDLPYTLLDRGQITQIVATIGAMFATIQAKLSPVSQSTPSALSAKQAPATISPYQAAWQQADAHTPAWTEQVAFYRWQVGHHFFDLCAIFCTDALHSAECAIREEAIQTGVHSLEQAETFLRGTTAAMWYAGDFSAQIYQQIIRPSMVMPGTPAGFSGDQNADYNRMKKGKQQLKKLLRECYGNDLVAMHPLLHRSLLRFHEADIENDEQHLLIAAHKVGVDQSLAQKEWQAELPDLAYKQTALDALRETAERRRREFTPAR